MARANDGIVDYLCNPRVNAPTVVAEVAVERRRQQWMREVDRPVATFDDLGGDGRVERPGCDAYPFEERFGARPPGGRDAERLSRGRRKVGDSRSAEVVARVRTR